MKSYIFITTEGVTYQPYSESTNPDIENCQVIGFSTGINAQDAFDKLIEDNQYLMETNFEEIFSLELKSDGRSNFNLKQYKPS
jgi:hypothetical protein